jgi:hypothetical protein
VVQKQLKPFLPYHVSFHAEYKPDWVWSSIYEKQRLETMIQRAQCLGSTVPLEEFEQLGGPMMCVTDSEPQNFQIVTLEQIDELLDRIAVASPLSSFDLRKRSPQQADASSGV